MMREWLMRGLLPLLAPEGGEGGGDGGGDGGGSATEGGGGGAGVAPSGGSGAEAGGDGPAEGGRGASLLSPGGESGEGGASGSDWRAALPEDLRNDTTLKPIKDLGALAKGYVEAQRMLGRDRLPVPRENDKPDAWNKVWDALGRPESADKYDVGDFRPPEDLPWNSDVQTAMMGKFHEAGLNNAQAKALLGSYAETQKAALDAFVAGEEKAIKEAEVALRRDFGDAYDRNVDLAQRAAEFAFGDSYEDIRHLKDATGRYLLDRPEMVRALARVGEAMSEEGYVGTGGGLPPMANGTPAAAKARLAEIRNDPAYNDRKAPNHQALHKEALALSELANRGS